MPHYAFALLHIALAAVSFFLAFNQYKQNNFRVSALLLMLGGGLLRMYVASDLFLHEWDERYHALVAKNLMSNLLFPKLYPSPLLSYNPGEWASNYIWLHKQPLPLWMMAVSLRLFGLSELALRIPSVIVSTLAIYLTYFIGKKLFDEKTALLAAFFHAINGLAIELTGGRVATDHIDVFFLFFVELAVVLSIISSERKGWGWVILTGICIGLAVLCKWLPAFIVILIWLILNYNRRKLADIAIAETLILLSALAIFLPWQIYVYLKFPVEYNIEMERNYRHLVEVLDKQGGNAFYYFYKLFITVNEFVWLAFLWFCYKATKKDHRRKRLALLAWVVFPFLFFSVAKTKMQGYLLFTYPAFFIILSAGSLALLQVHLPKSRVRFQHLLFAVVIFLSVRYSIERTKPLQDQSKQLAWSGELKKLHGSDDEKKVYVNMKHYIEGMFYTNSIMYEYMPSQQQLDELKARGYTVIVNQNPDL